MEIDPTDALAASSAPVAGGGRGVASASAAVGAPAGSLAAALLASTALPVSASGPPVVADCVIIPTTSQGSGSEEKNSLHGGLLGSKPQLGDSVSSDALVASSDPAASGGRAGPASGRAWCLGGVPCGGGAGGPRSALAGR